MEGRGLKVSVIFHINCINLHMVKDCKIIVYLTVTSHKYAKIAIPQIMNQSCVDDLILLVQANDSYTKGYIQTTKIEYGDKIQILNIAQSKNIDMTVADTFKTLQHKKQEICVYFGDKICFISPNCIQNLASCVLEYPEYEMIYPAGVNTERTTYIYQATNHLKPHLLWKWNADYLDDFSFKKTPLSFHVELHEFFLNELENKEVKEFDFGHYIISPKETTPTHAFATRGDVCTNHFKNTKNNLFSSPHKHIVGMLCGDAICSWFTNIKHQNGLESSGLLNRYQQLGHKVYESKPLQSKTNIDDISEFDIGLTPGALFSNFTGEFEIKFAISSHVSTCQKTLPVLLKSLKEASVLDENILVVVGGSSKQYIEKKNNIVYSYVTHNSFDHNALIDIVEKGWGGDWWFVLHDTMKVGIKFQERLLSIGPKASYIAALKEGWMNIGLFSKSAIRDMSNYIIQLKNCNKMQAILSEKLYARMCESSYYDIIEQINFPYYGDIYGDGVDRQVMYMPTIDLYKFQSFHYHSSTTKKLINDWVIEC